MAWQTSTTSGWMSAQDGSARTASSCPASQSGDRIVSAGGASAKNAREQTAVCKWKRWKAKQTAHTSAQQTATDEPSESEPGRSSMVSSSDCQTVLTVFLTNASTDRASLTLTAAGHTTTHITHRTVSLRGGSRRARTYCWAASGPTPR
jgi:hypothetical protein